ncbi:MAG: redoxin family protein [Dysgonamonadaceae bacterium]|jgi:thiol-disulfide isomerase/thioredoxin|nr:redoxin family protein [Dysgonamonadaceae bacterium]
MQTKYFSGDRRRSFANMAVAALCLSTVFACKEKPADVVAMPVFDVWSTAVAKDKPVIQVAKFHTDADRKANKAVIRQVPKVVEELVLGEIVKRYRGKIVVVDFWATWCGPCLQAFKEMAPLKESWKDKNIVFVYLTGETSPLATWNKMIPDIHGEHYRVNNNQWRYFGSSLKIEAIPTYILYDRNGKQVQRYTGYPGTETLKQVIEAL